MHVDDDPRVRRVVLMAATAAVVTLGIFGYWLLLGRPLVNAPRGADAVVSEMSATTNEPPAAVARDSASRNEGMLAGAAPSGDAGSAAEQTSSGARGTATAREVAAGTMPAGASSPGDSSSAPVAEATGAEAGAEETADADAAQATTAALPSERERGEQIALRSRPGVFVTVERVEWHDRMQIQDGEGTSYVDPVLGRFLVVVFEIANETTSAIAPTDLSIPIVEDEAGHRYGPSPQTGIVAGGQQPDVLRRQRIEAQSTGTHVEFFDVPFDFGGGYLRSDVDNYRVAVGPAS